MNLADLLKPFVLKAASGIYAKNIKMSEKSFFSEFDRKCIKLKAKMAKRFKYLNSEKLVKNFDKRTSQSREKL